MYRSFISSGALIRASELEFLTVVSENTVLGSHVPSLHEDKDFSAVDSKAIIFIFSFLGDFLMPMEFRFSVLTLGMVMSFSGNACCSLSAFLSKNFDYGNNGNVVIIFSSN